MAHAAEQSPNVSVDDEGENLLKIRIDTMQKKLKEPPRLLSSTAGKPTCSIFRIPPSMINCNDRFDPRVASVGPYHRGKTHLKMIEEHKWHYLNNLLVRTQNLTLEDYMKSVKNVEEDARECYSESIHMESEEFNEMMVLDGCFLLELFRKVKEVVPFNPNDPLATMVWVLPYFYRDFLRLENQIPFFVLETLFDLTRGENEKEFNVQSLAFAFFNNAMNRKDKDLDRFKDLKAKHLLDLVRSSLIPEKLEVREKKEKTMETPSHIIHSISNVQSLAFEIFNNAMNRKDKDLDRFKDLKAKHLLDLVRSSLIPEKLEVREKKEKTMETPSHIIHSISKLRRAGIRLKELKGANTFLDVKYRRGVIEMPTITIDDFMSSFLENCVAYEQCYVGCSKQFTSYATLLDCLMNSNKDVEYLCDENIIENYFGTETEIAKFVNSLGQNVAYDTTQCYLNELFGQVHKYYKSDRNVIWANMISTYFSSPWSFISALAAFVLLVLSVIQTVYTVTQAYKS